MPVDLKAITPEAASASTLFAGSRTKPDPDRRPPMPWLAIACWTVVAALCILRFCYLTADFPNFTTWMSDQAKYTDEGWWASGAIAHHLLGHWSVAGDYNPAAALPVWPATLAILFYFTGVSVVAARALDVTFSIATLGLVFLLVRRYMRVRSQTAAMFAVLLLSASPFAFVFSRLAILETFVSFQFCLILLVSSYASAKRLWPLVILPVLITIMLLTKTTAGLLLPAVLWLAWNAMDQTMNQATGKKKPPAFLRAILAILAVGVVPALLLKTYSTLLMRSTYGTDYKYFFDVNAMPDIGWDHTLATISELLRNGFWVDRFLYPIGILVLVLSVAWRRRLWSNPLFTASWITLATQAAFIFSRQDDYAPRYFLWMLIPLVLIVVLAFGDFALGKRTSAVFLSVMAISVAANAAMIVSFVTHRQYQFYDAASSIRRIIQSDSGQNHLILGVSGSQISLMTGIPSISDAYGTEDMAQKILQYRPGWCLVWNNAINQDVVSLFQLEKVANYPAFDDDDRNMLILYKMKPRATAAPPQN
jgi:hypothetical protein